MLGAGRLYTVSFTDEAFTAANGDYDYFELIPATNRLIVVEALYVKVTTELGDAQEEWIRWSLVRGHTTSGNGTATTPQPVLDSDAAPSFTAERVASTPASAGTPETIHQDAYNVRVGLEYVMPPEHRIPVSAAESRLAIRQLTSFADDAQVSATVYVREL